MINNFEAHNDLSIIKTNKDKANKEKHGIDFKTAEALWIDKHRIEIEAPFPIEQRWILIAKINARYLDCNIYN